MSQFNKLLKEREELIRLIRCHPLVYFKPGFMALILLLLPFFLMFLLFRWGNIGLIIFILLVIIGVYAIVRLLVVYSLNVLLITNQRVILLKQRGMFDRTVAEVEYGKIQDSSYRFKGLFQNLFKYGSIKMQIVNSTSVLLIEKIHRPEKIQRLIAKIKNDYQNS